MNSTPCCLCFCPQDSEILYCGRLSLVADLLQGLFKEAYSLQKSLLEVLDRISLDSSASDEEVSDIVTGVSTCVYGRMHPSVFHCNIGHCEIVDFILSRYFLCSLKLTCQCFTVIHSLLDICSIISNLDIALHANTWKFLIK